MQASLLNSYGGPLTNQGLGRQLGISNELGSSLAHLAQPSCVVRGPAGEMEKGPPHNCTFSEKKSRIEQLGRDWQICTLDLQPTKKGGMELERPNGNVISFIASKKPPTPSSTSCSSFEISHNLACLSRLASQEPCEIASAPPEFLSQE